MSEYHDILGVPANARKEVIKRAFRKLAMKWHPDRNPDPQSEGRFMKIHNAYEVLVEGKKVRKKTRKRPPKPSPREKYQHVYRAPTDPLEYEEWRKVAKERAQYQARGSYKDFKEKNKAFLTGSLYWVYLLIYVCSILFIVSSIGGVLALTIYALWDNWIMGLFACVFVIPMLVGVSMYYRAIIDMASMFRDR